jgi:hypothetical protein
VKTISGSSYAAYDSYGNDKLRASDGLINTAKSNMYQNHSFMPNQVITNISRDVIKTYVDKGWGKFEIKVVMSADVYEFSENGVFLSDNSESKPPDHKNVIPTEINNEPNSIISEDIMTGFIAYTKDLSIKKGTKVLFKAGQKYYKGEVKYRINSTGEYLLINIMEYDQLSKKWNLSEKDNIKIPKSLFIGFNP